MTFEKKPFNNEAIQPPEVAPTPSPAPNVPPKPFP